jgi:phosphoribosylformimino-5-aminoimidazole carboxamide ribotide isomerase
MNIIPALDLLDGQCVRLQKGDFTRKIIYHQDPLEAAKSFESAGIKYLHLVDLDGARAGAPVNMKILEKLAASTDLQIDFGGGLRTTAALQSVFDAGARQVTVGSIALQRSELFAAWLSEFGAERIVLAADCRNGVIAFQGWQNDSEKLLLPFLQQQYQSGVRRCMVTDIEKDGMLEGPSFEMYQTLIASLPPSLKIVASGGVSSLADLHQLGAIGCESAIVGKAIYEGNITLEQLRNYAEKTNYSVS